jgi:hypothetical protein
MFENVVYGCSLRLEVKDRAYGYELRLKFKDRF